MINCDAKIFTRLLNEGITNAASSLMPARLIGVNGLTTRIAMEQALQDGSSKLGLLLSQEKAFIWSAFERSRWRYRMCSNVSPIAGIIEVIFPNIPAIHLHVRASFIACLILIRRLAILSLGTLIIMVDVLK